MWLALPPPPLLLLLRLLQLQIPLMQHHRRLLQPLLPMQQLNQAAEVAAAVEGMVAVSLELQPLLRLLMMKRGNSKKKKTKRHRV